MSRKIKPLFNFEPPASDDEIRAAALQFAKKISGFGSPSTVNQKAIDSAVESISQSVRELLGSLSTTANPKNRDEESHKAKLRSIKRFE